MTAHALIEEHPQIFELDYLQQEMAIEGTDEDARQLEESLAPYLEWINRFLSSGEDFPTHIENSGSLAVPIGNTTTPDDLFATLGEKLNLYSSAIKINTQYMHTLWFDLELKHDTSLDEVKLAFRNNPRVAVTNKRYVNEIFSFGRDHGYYGRILSQTVVPISTVAVPHPRKVVGFCYTPQDGNSLLSSVAATLRLLDVTKLEDQLDALRPYIFREI